MSRALLRRYGVVFWRLIEREAAWLHSWRATECCIRDNLPMALLVAGEVTFFSQLDSATEWQARQILLRARAGPIAGPGVWRHVERGACYALGINGRLSSRWKSRLLARVGSRVGSSSGQRRSTLSKLEMSDTRGGERL